MKKSDAKKLIAYLEKLQDNFSKKEQFDEMAEYIAILEAEVEKESITICQLRKMFPHHEFYFFKNGKEIPKSPFVHDIIKSYKVKKNAIFIEM